MTHSLFTLLNIIGTLDRATSGELIIGGKNINHLSADQLADYRNQTIGFVFQFHYLLPEFTTIENVLMPYRIQHGKVPREMIKKSGQQQRTAIARALINNLKIILADEPTGNLDSDSTEKIYDLLRSINQDYNTTFVIITHDRRIAEKAD